MEPKSLSLAALSSSVGPGQSHSYSCEFPAFHMTFYRSVADILASIHSGIAEAKRKSLIHARESAVSSLD